MPKTIEKLQIEKILGMPKLILDKRKPEAHEFAGSIFDQYLASEGIPVKDRIDVVLAYLARVDSIGRIANQDPIARVLAYPNSPAYVLGRRFHSVLFSK